jgi:hypothetical protein
MDDPDSTGQPASTGHNYWERQATQAGQPGLVVSELGGRRDLYCFDPGQPIITDRPPDWLGFGGQPFSIGTADGQVMVTNNLSHLGQIPPEFHGSFPSNAVVTVLPAGDTYEVAYSGEGHNLRRVTASSPQGSLATAARMSSAGDPVDVVHVRGDGTRSVIARFAGGRPLAPGAQGNPAGAAGTARPAAASGTLARLEFPGPPATGAARQGPRRRGPRATLASRGQRAGPRPVPGR